MATARRNGQKGKARKSVVEAPRKIDTPIATLTFGTMPKRTRRTSYVDLLEEFKGVPGSAEARINMKSDVKPQSAVLALRRTIKRDTKFKDLRVMQVGDEVWIKK